jgi:hypothetical protein
MYQVHYTGGSLTGMILQKELSRQNGCEKYFRSEPLITGKHRMQLCDELFSHSYVDAAEMKIMVSDSVGSHLLFDEDGEMLREGNRYRYAWMKELPLHLYIQDQINASSDVMISANMNEYQRASAVQRSDAPRLFIWCRQGPLEYREETNNCFLFACSRSEVMDVVKKWVAEIIFPRYGVKLAEKLKGGVVSEDMDPKLARIQEKVLTGRTPYLELKLPDRLELSSTGRFEFIKCPADIPCKIYSSDAKVALLGSGGVIKPTGEGSAMIIAQVKDHPELHVSGIVTVYRYLTVQKIRMQASVSSMVVGDQCRIQCTYTPANAHNLDQGQWEIVPGNLLKQVSPDTFVAMQSGTCEVIRRVGNVKESVTLQIAPQPSSISFDKQALSVKLGDNSKTLKTEVHPPGSKGGSVKYRISDISILDIDSNNGQLKPKREGSVMVTAILSDQNGNLVDDCNCDVTVLPPVDVVTPDGALVLLLLSLIGAILLIRTNLRYLCGVTGLAGAIWYAIRTDSKSGYLIDLGLIALTIAVVCLGGIL